jgi:hypothetical protein
VSGADWKGGAGAIPHVIDTLDVELFDDTLAVARVKMHTQFIKGRWVFTFTSDGGWRIVACVHETKLP